MIEKRRKKYKFKKPRKKERCVKKGKKKLHGNVKIPMLFYFNISLHLRLFSRNLNPQAACHRPFSFTQEGPVLLRGGG